MALNSMTVLLTIILSVEVLLTIGTVKYGGGGVVILQIYYNFSVVSNLIETCS